MGQKFKTNIQILVILFMAVVFLVCLAMLVGNNIQPPIVIAQEPTAGPDAIRDSFSKERLAAFGLSLEEIEAAAGPVNLQVGVRSSAVTVPTGGAVTFTIAVTNPSTSPNNTQYILFSQTLPNTMIGGTNPNFGGLTAISNGLNPPTWLITNPLAKGTSISFTVSGTLNSACNAIALYTARVVPFNIAEEVNLANNTASRTVNINSGSSCAYLPIIRRDPTPTPNPIVFFDNFSGEQRWSSADNDDCERAYVSDEYQMKANTEDENCFSPAPEAAERSFGTFKVRARRTDGSSNFTVAVYSNGSGSGNYYAFEVNPHNDCGWRLIRRRDGNNNTVRDGGCDAAISRESGTNTLEIRHFSNGNVSVFINNIQVGSTYNDGSQLTGEGTGFYIRTNSSDDVTVRFDDFTVIQP